ncbi:MAG: hypothetical protein KAJ07_04940 [Planctomycetes bacterium]|nr:hypothetical protein [Planctomycetota bacterium]
MNIFKVSEDGSIVPPVLVYSTSKTGGNTIQASLNSLKINNGFTHFLGWDRIAKASSRGREHLVVVKSAEIMSTIDCLRGKVRMKVITSVRDPIAKDISVAFHGGFHSSDKMRTQVEGLALDESVSVINEMLLKRLRGFDEAENAFCVWFDRYLKPVFDFDIYSHEFDKEKGYQIYHAKDADILCLKLEKLKDCHKEAFEEFLGIKEFPLVNDNFSSARYYGELYKKTVHNLTVPEDVLDGIYACRTAMHFYSKKEIDGFKEKWSVRKRQSQGFSETLPDEIKQVEQFNTMGEQYFANGDHANALRQFSMSLKLNPIDKRSVVNCVRTLVYLGDIETAVKICSDYISAVPADFDVMEILSVLENAKKNLIST